MKSVKLILFFAFLSFLGTVSAAEKINWKSTTEIVCGPTGFYICVGDDDLKELVGKTIKYKHPRGGDFGTVAIALKQNKSIDARNGKGAASGGWDIKDGKFVFKTNNWGDFALGFIRIGDYLFIILNRDTPGASSIVPVEVSE